MCSTIKLSNLINIHVVLIWTSINPFFRHLELINSKAVIVTQKSNFIPYMILLDLTNMQRGILFSDWCFRGDYGGNMMSGITWVEFNILNNLRFGFEQSCDLDHAVWTVHCRSSAVCHKPAPFWATGNMPVFTSILIEFVGYLVHNRG